MQATSGPLHDAAQLAWGIPRALSAGQFDEAFNMATELYSIADDPRYVIASIVEWAVGAAALLGDGDPLVIEAIYTPEGKTMAVADAPPEVSLTSRLIVMASNDDLENAAECLMLTPRPLLHMVFMEMVRAYAELLATHFLNPN